jgi:hypothetical protein
MWSAIAPGTTRIAKPLEESPLGLFACWEVILEEAKWLSKKLTLDFGSSKRDITSEEIFFSTPLVLTLFA